MTVDSPNKYEWVEDPPEVVLCIVCEKVARDPYQHGGQAGCGKVLCKSCFESLDQIICPNCSGDLTLFEDARGKV